MKTRKNFMQWVEKSSCKLNNININYSRFYDIGERGYVFRVLEELMKLNNEYDPFINDYINLEHQRYHIIDNHVVNENIAIFQINEAIKFCSKSNEAKRSSKFLMNSFLPEYICESIFFWDMFINEIPKLKNSYYLFIPSFLNVAPKEIFLIDLDALLLDLKDYKDEFTYYELFELLKENLDLKEKDLDIVLLEYISNQILYYRTIIPIN